MKHTPLILTMVGDIDLDSLQPSFNNKEGRVFFFKWESHSLTLENGMKPFIQVVLSPEGDFLRYVNTLPVGQTKATYILENMGLLPSNAKASFNEVYANGGNYWTWDNENYSMQPFEINRDWMQTSTPIISPNKEYMSFSDSTTSVIRSVSSGREKALDLAAEKFLWSPD